MEMMIGGGLVVAALIALYVRLAVVVTAPGWYNIIATSWGTRPSYVEEVGWTVPPWPYERAIVLVTRQVFTEDMKEAIFNCLVTDADEIVNQVTDEREQGLAAIKTKEVSYAYQFDFSERDPSSSPHITDWVYEQDLLERFFELVTVNEDGSLDRSILEERIKDWLHASFKKHGEGLTIYKAKNFPAAKRKLVQADLEKEIMRNNVPIKLRDLAINAPFETVDPKIDEAISERSRLALEREAKVAAATNDVQVTKIEINSAKNRAEAISVTKTELAAAYHLDNLPPDEYLRAQLSIEAMQALEKLAASDNTKVVLSPAILNEVDAILGGLRLGGRAAGGTGS
jgi:hypothetical protein